MGHPVRRAVILGYMTMMATDGEYIRRSVTLGYGNRVWVQMGNI